ncbi:MAG: prepilin-type N-terminal cleavage/methylation domain-containing protein [Candidatus Omnitrophica bacterium]|nr:prepilin-type N-terminal cleavage/methylation domain-containing protein [Candidatus Omnitrophota bacterium]
MNRKAFTLTELVMVVVLSGIIAGILSILIRQVSDVYTFVRVRGVALSDNRLAMNRMMREIRQIKSSFNLYKAQETALRLYKIDNECVEFYLSGTELKRKGGSDDILATDVTLLEFTYYDTGNTELTTPSVAPDETNVWRILIKLTVKKGNETVKFQSQVHPRNL